jgi:hypothetical protein
MNDPKLKQLFNAAGKEVPPAPADGFEARVIRSLGRKSPVETLSLWQELERLFPRVALASLLLAGACVLGDYARTSPELACDLDTLSAQWLFAGNPV